MFNLMLTMLMLVCIYAEYLIYFVLNAITLNPHFQSIQPSLNKSGFWQLRELPEN